MACNFVQKTFLLYVGFTMEERKKPKQRKLEPRGGTYKKVRKLCKRITCIVEMKESQAVHV
jgi:hypothetical protein